MTCARTLQARDYPGVRDRGAGAEGVGRMSAQPDAINPLQPVLNLRAAQLNAARCMTARVASGSGPVEKTGPHRVH
jgi:hypothetical protein